MVGCLAPNRVFFHSNLRNKNKNKIKIALFTHLVNFFSNFIVVFFLTDPNGLPIDYQSIDLEQESFFTFKLSSMTIRWHYLAW